MRSEIDMSLYELAKQIVEQCSMDDVIDLIHLLTLGNRKKRSSGKHVTPRARTATKRSGGKRRK